MSRSEWSREFTRWLSMQDVVPDCPPLKTAAEMEDGVYFTPYEAHLLWGIIRDSLCDDQCHCCGRYVTSTYGPYGRIPLPKAHEADCQGIALLRRLEEQIR